MAFERAAWQPYVTALVECHLDGADRSLVVHDAYGAVDEWPVAHFFRDASTMPPLESRALELAGGRILDVGAGTGCHTLALQQRGESVTALEPLPELVDVMTQRGVQHAVCARLDECRDQFDTVLLLMNGLGLSGTMRGLAAMLEDLHHVVAPGGQVLADSTDVTGVYESRENGRYVGEWTFWFEYDGAVGVPFSFLYVDPACLERMSSAAGWDCAIAAQDGDSYLFRLTRA